MATEHTFVFLDTRGRLSVGAVTRSECEAVALSEPTTGGCVRVVGSEIAPLLRVR